MIDELISKEVFGLIPGPFLRMVPCSSDESKIAIWIGERDGRGFLWIDGEEGLAKRPEGEYGEPTLFLKGHSMEKALRALESVLEFHKQMKKQGDVALYDD